MSPQEKYGTAEHFMLFVTRMELYPEKHIEEIKEYLMHEYAAGAARSSQTYERALEACVGQFLTQLQKIIEEDLKEDA